MTGSPRGPRLADIPYHLRLDDLYVGPPERRSCLMRLWEDTYSAYPLCCFGERYDLGVFDRPSSATDARDLADQQVEFAPEAQRFDVEGEDWADCPERISQALVGLARWDFWWDWMHAQMHA